MERFRKISGPLGLALVLIGVVTYGILYTSGWIAFLPLLVGLALAVTSIVMNVRGAKSEGAKRSARFGISTSVSILFLAAILIFLQTLSARHSANLDTTRNKRFSLSPQTVNILKGLEREVNFTCFFKETTGGKVELEDLLEEYGKKSQLVGFRFIDPDKDPVTARRYEITAYGTIVAESGGMEEKLYETSEDKITNVILKVTREKKKAIYFVTGHGEKSIMDEETSGLSEAKKSLAGENYDVKEILTLREERIPDDCAILVIAGPTNDLFPPETEMITSYIDGGGKVLALIDPLTELPKLSEMLERYGIRAGNNIIIDRFGRVLAGNYLTPVVNKYGDHPITKGFRMASFFPQARALERTEDTGTELEIAPLASTGSSAYAETDIETLLAGKTQFEGDKDLSGPVDIAFVVTEKEAAPTPAEQEEPARRRKAIAVFGDSDFASNAYLNLSGNRDFVMNTLNWLAEEEDLVAIRPKDALVQPVILTARQGRVVFWLPVVGLPALVAAIGIAVAIQNRRSA